jgi:transposase
MQIKTILNRVAKQPGFVFGRVNFLLVGLCLTVELVARKGSRGICSGCGRRGPCYDHLSRRQYEFVPLWKVPVFFLYAPRRIDCKACGVLVERVPWAIGNSPITVQYGWFLASWAKVMSWTEVGRRFDTSWHTVFTAVNHAVQWGKEHRDLTGITAIGVDEIAWKKGHKYMTVVYQVDHNCRRLLWIGQDRTAATFAGFFDWLGKERSALLQFVISDMWKAFLSTVAKRAAKSVHVLDRFHVVKLANEAVNNVRKNEAQRLRAKGDTVTLKNTRWVWLKHRRNHTGKQRNRLKELREANLQTFEAFLLKEDLDGFWGYKSVHHARNYLQGWIATALGSGIEPMAKFARTLDSHLPLLLNWFAAKGKLAMGAVEGMNNKARVTTKMAYGFRTYKHAEIALFHRLGALPEPEFAHRFS